jgi:hypothetical protein
MPYKRSITMAIVFMSSFCSITAIAQQKNKAYPKWEYKIVNSCNPEERGIDIQQLGEEGWELISTDEQNCLVRYFKRPKGPEYKQITRQPSPPSAPQQPAPQCSIPLDKAPAIRGFRLGSSVEEILPLVTTNKRANIERVVKNAGPAPSYGLATFQIQNDYEIANEAKEKFAGIRSISFMTLDGRIVEINVSYEHNPNLYPSWTVDEWTSKVSNTFGLPGVNDWELSSDKMRRTLKCKALEVKTGVVRGIQNLPGIGTYSSPTLIITDPSYRQVIEQRAKADQEKKQREFAF